jgi:hypothetical protein
MNEMRKFPQLNAGEFAVSMADGATGHILLDSGQISFNDTDNIYKVFSSIENAMEYIKTKQNENDTWEFVLHDHFENMIKYFPAVRWVR